MLRSVWESVPCSECGSPYAAHDVHVVAPNQAYRSIAPGEEITFDFVARDPGVYVVHCGTPPVLLHIMQGMYLSIIVDPKEGWGADADREFVIVQSEFYAAPGVEPSDAADLVRRLREQLAVAVSDENFEQAAELRDRLRGLE